MVCTTSSYPQSSGRNQDNPDDHPTVSPPSRSKLPSPTSHDRNNFQHSEHVNETSQKINRNSLAVTVSLPSAEGQSTDHSDTSRPGSYYRASSSSISRGSHVITPVTSNAPSDHDPVDKGPSQQPDLRSLIYSSLIVCTRPINPAREDDNPAVDVERFVPDDAIQRLICPELVRRTWPDFSQEQLEGVFRNRKRLFAILTMIRQAELITKLVEEEVDDSCLPFQIDKDGVLQYRSRSETSSRRKAAEFQPIRCLKNTHRFNSGLVYEFDQFQWQFLAPNLGIDCPCDGYLNSKLVEHRRFMRRERVPFIKITPTSKYCDPERSRHEVATAYVHPAHRNPCRHSPSHEPDPCQCRDSAHETPCRHQKLGPPCCAGPFAVKLISDIRRREAGNEISSLRLFQRSGEKYRHRIIRLLCSFEYDTDYYLIFPHADANLWQFWEEKYPLLTDLPRGPALTRWVAGEMLGLVRGLQLIHNPPAAPDDDSDKRPRGQLNGRHGDLKPENILWFSHEHDDYLSNSPTDSKQHRMPVSGILKICDFDTADLHSDYTVSHNNDGRYLVKTDAYSAPESALCDSISQRYDSWSLGCILLQFVTWYALGWCGVEALEAAIRKDATTSPNLVLGLPVPMARFFGIDASSGTKKAYLIPAVAEQIRMLHDLMSRDHEEQYHLFFSGVLNTIEFDLLRTNPADRALTGMLEDDFHDLYRRCLTAASNNRQNEGHPRPDQLSDPSPVATVHAQKDGPRSCRQRHGWHRRILTFFRRVAGIFRPGRKAFPDQRQ